MTFDLDGYLSRIGYGGARAADLDVLRALHGLQPAAIPFENLDPRRGVPVSLESKDIERKLVTSRRGGYCFEQNLLLKAALETLGIDADMYLARVRLGCAGLQSSGRR